MEHFTPLASTFGGMLIGLAAGLLLLSLGRIAGVSGIFGGILVPKAGDLWWRVSFVLGLVAGGVLMESLRPEWFGAKATPGLVTVGVAGLFVGFGTRMGNGCTSGHGVCGLSRLSVRSLVATVTFIAAGALTVFVVRHMLGGGSP